MKSHLALHGNRAALMEALAAGRTLVVDRYAYSGAAFTAAKRLPGLDLAWCQACYKSSAPFFCRPCTVQHAPGCNPSAAPRVCTCMTSITS